MFSKHTIRYIYLTIIGIILGFYIGFVHFESPSHMKSLWLKDQQIEKRDKTIEGLLEILKEEKE